MVVGCRPRWTKYPVVFVYDPLYSTCSMYSVVLMMEASVLVTVLALMNSVLPFICSQTDISMDTGQQIILAVTVNIILFNSSESQPCLSSI